MSYTTDILSILNAICFDASLCLRVDIRLDNSLVNSLTDQKTTVRVLTKDLPEYDAKLLRHFKGEAMVISDLVEPFSSLWPLVEEGNVLAVDCWRKIALFGKKLKAPVGAELRDQMINRMYWTDKSLPWRLMETPILRLAATLIREVLTDYLPVEFGDAVCGSGASADKVPVPMRYNDCFIKGTSVLNGWFGISTELTNMDHFISRLLTVPKDARGPRIICCEQNVLMMAQKSVQLFLHKLFNSHKLTRARVNVLDQKINQELARIGSLNDSWATIDMAEASDRISYALVMALFPPSWRELLKACRSLQYKYGSNRPVTMRKFAPMGSALCFPIETLCFWAIASAAIARSKGCRVEEAAKLVTVHGDDTIVPKQYARDVIKALESVHLVVNENKSFLEGPFRESCGGDYYHGYSVNPVRHNNIWRNEHERYEQLLILRNSFYLHGYWHTAKAIEGLQSKSTDASTLESSHLEFSHVTVIPGFVGGYLVKGSYQLPCLSVRVGTPVKESIRPNQSGLRNNYWLTIGSIEHTTIRSAGGLFDRLPYSLSSDGHVSDAKHWRGTYDHTVVRIKGKVKCKKDTVFMKRDKRKFRRSAINVDLGQNNVLAALICNKLKKLNATNSRKTVAVTMSA